MKKLNLVLVLLLVLSLVFSACSKTETDENQVPEATEAVVEEGLADETEAADKDSYEWTTSVDMSEKLTISLNMRNVDMELENNAERIKYLEEKFNIEFDIWPANFSDWRQKELTWMATQEVPDILWSTFHQNNVTSLMESADADILQAWNFDDGRFPYAQEYLDGKVVDDMLMTWDDEVYGWPSGQGIQWAGAAYAPQGFHYRRDWAEAVGMANDNDIYTVEEFEAMVLKILEEDPGNVGIQLAGVGSFGFYGPVKHLGYDESVVLNADTQEYEYTLLDEENVFAITTNNRWYQNGVLWEDQPLARSKNEAINKYTSGQMIVEYSGHSATAMGQMYTAYKEAFPGTTDEDLKDIFCPLHIVNSQGKIYAANKAEYWTASFLSGMIDDNKADRIRAMYDFMCSPEGRGFLNFGIPGEHFKFDENGEYVVLWEKDENGKLIAPSFASHHLITDMIFPTVETLDWFDPDYNDELYLWYQNKLLGVYMDTSHGYEIDFRPFDYVRWRNQAFNPQPTTDRNEFLTNITIQDISEEEIVAELEKYADGEKEIFDALLAELNDNNGGALAKERYEQLVNAGVID